MAEVVVKELHRQHRPLRATRAEAPVGKPGALRRYQRARRKLLVQPLLKRLVPAPAVIPFRIIAQQCVTKAHDAVSVDEWWPRVVVLIGVGDRQRDLILLQHRSPDDLRPCAEQQCELVAQRWITGGAQLLQLEIELIDRRLEIRAGGKNRSGYVRAVSPLFLRLGVAELELLDRLRALGEVVGRDYMMPRQPVAAPRRFLTGVPRLSASRYAPASRRTFRTGRSRRAARRHRRDGLAPFLY